MSIPNRPIPAKSLNLVQQWASRVIEFSSQYNNTTWSANMCLGPPRNYPNYGDLQNTWAQANDNLGRNFIELGFPQEVYVTRINVYETYHAGGIVAIKLRNKQLGGTWVSVWEAPNGQARNIEMSRIFSPELERSSFRTDEIRLELDCSVSNSYCEIDAVELVGKKQLVDAVLAEKSLEECLAKLLTSEELSDVKFKVDGKFVNAHKNIITARSDYFRALLCEKLSDDRLKRPIFIENISHDAFKSLLYFIYTGRIEENSSVKTVCELARASEWYGVDGLKERCHAYAKASLCVENVIPFFLSSLDTEPVLDVIEDACLRFIAKNFAQLIERAEFKQLPQKYLIHITQFYAQFQK